MANQALERACQEIRERISEKTREDEKRWQRLRCPVAERIIANNSRKITAGGMAGALQVLMGLDSPETFKRKAASLIAFMRINRQSLKDQRRNHRGADARILAHVAWCRRQATRLGKPRAPTNQQAKQQYDFSTPAIKIQAAE